MSQNINIISGISTIGNPTSEDALIASLNVNTIKSYKTLEGGVWTSWSKGAPNAFQGFLALNKGYGYVVNSDTIANFTLPAPPLDVNEVTYPTGLAMIAAPFNNRLIGSGYIPRLKLASLKTIDSTWKSWAFGAPNELQGFLDLDITKGYVANISEVYGTYLNNDVQNKAEGVRFNTSNTNMTNGEVSEGVSYTDPNNVGSLSFDKVAFDNTVPTMIQFVSINGMVAKIEFPTELAGSKFFIPNGGNTFRGTFAENEDYANPTVITNTVDGMNLELSYDPKPVNVVTATFKEMVIKYDDVEAVIEYATEYEGDSLKVWKDGKVGTTVFSEGTTNVTIA